MRISCKSWSSYVYCPKLGGMLIFLVLKVPSLKSENVLQVQIMCACKGRFVSQSGPPTFSQSVKSVSSCLSIILPDHFSLYHNCNFSSSSISGLIRHYKEPELLLAGSAMAVLFSLHATQDLMECLLFVATSEPLSKCIPNQFWETCCVQMNLSVTFEVMWIK